MFINSVPILLEILFKYKRVFQIFQQYFGHSHTHTHIYIYIYIYIYTYIRSQSKTLKEKIRKHAFNRKCVYIKYSFYKISHFKTGSSDKKTVLEWHQKTRIATKKQKSRPHHHYRRHGHHFQNILNAAPAYIRCTCNNMQQPPTLTTTATTTREKFLNWQKKKQNLKRKTQKLFAIDTQCFKMQRQ